MCEIKLGLLLFSGESNTLWCVVVGAVKKEVYFMAIIDILTHYDAKKKAAHAAKTVKHGVSTDTPSSSSSMEIKFWVIVSLFNHYYHSIQ